ncbi:MAG: NlpC/P60 family protein [Acidimicrobiia bacterium]
MTVATMVAAVIATASALPSAPAGATPTDDILGRAATLEQSLIENGKAIDALSEQYDAAVARRDLAQRQLEFGRVATAALSARRDEVAANARTAARVIYLNQGRLTPLESLQRPSDPHAGRSKYLDAAGHRLTEMIAEYRRVEHALASRAEAIDGYRRRVQAEADLIGEARSRAVVLEAHQRELLAQVRGRLADVLSLRRAAEDPDAAGLEARLRLLGVGALPVAPSPNAAKAVAFAIAQLGKPYVFAAAGPDTWDCSGLTMMAWRQAGVTMPHFAAAQFAAFPHVSIDDLQPGDLVFFYPTIHHVGIYIGGGKMINAPHTGDVVRVASIYRGSLVGAVRPG